MVQYYPHQLSIPRLNNIIAKDADLFKQLDPAGFEPVFFVDEAEQQRLADVASLKARGKGKPKKAKTPGQLALIITSTPTLKHLNERLFTNSPTEESRRAKKKGGSGKKK